MQNIFSRPAFILLICLSWAPAQQAVSATTGLDFVGGCPSGESRTGGLCDQGGNADVDNVAAILGVNSSMVSQIGVILGSSGSGAGFSIDSLDGSQTGTWSVTDPTITHFAFKAGTYFILAEVTTATGTWEMDPMTWDLSLIICPATICTVNPGPRAYIESDFLNNGGQIADISNLRAFSVVPIPAPLWLFGSGLLGLIGISRRKKAT